MRGLLMLLLLQPGVDTKRWLVENIISQLNNDFNTTLNIFVDFEYNNFLMDDLLRRTDTPRFLLSSKFYPNATQLRLEGRFTEQSLTIAYLEPATMNRTLNVVVELLWRLQHLPVLYVLSPRFGQLRQLFEHSLAYGLLRVLALYGDELLTYQPYPDIRLLPLQNLSDFRPLTQLSNLQGLEVYISRIIFSPRMFQYTNRQGRLVYAGYMYEFVHLFIDRYNGTERGVFDNADPTAIEIGVALRDGVINMLTRPAYPVREWNVFSSSDMLYHMNVFMVAPYARPIPKAYYFLRPFSTHLWLMIFASLVYAAVLLGWIHRRRQPGYSIAATFLEVLQLLWFLPLSTWQHYSQGWRRVFIFLALTLCGFVLTNLYLALLLSMLTSGLYEQQLNSFDDLAGTEWKIMQTDWDMILIEEFTNQTNLNPQVLAHSKAFPNNELNRERLKLNTSYMYCILEDIVDFILYQQKFLRVPIYKIVDDFLFRVPFFISVSHKLPYLELFNSYQRRVWESGILAKLTNNAQEQGIMSGELSFRLPTGLELRTFDMEFFYFAYCLLLLGWTVSLLVFLSEFGVWRWNSQKGNIFIQ